MATIPSTINGVTVEFSSTVNNDVEQVMIDGLNHCIKTNIATGYLLTKIYIPQGGAVTAVVDAIQTAFESFKSRRENFGPHFKKKAYNKRYKMPVIASAMCFGCGGASVLKFRGFNFLRDDYLDFSKYQR